MKPQTRTALGIAGLIGCMVAVDLLTDHCFVTGTLLLLFSLGLLVLSEESKGGRR